MKTIYKNLVLGAFLTAFGAVSATTTFAQDACADVPANQALYQKYLDNYAGTVPQIKVAIAAAKEYIQKYEGCKDAKGDLTFADQVKYFKDNLPEREKVVADFEQKSKNDADDKAMYDKFNAALKAKPPVAADVISSAKPILAKYPDAESSLDVNIVIANAAFDELIAKPTASTYNADLITHAKKAIEMIEAGKPSKNFGAGSYSLGASKDSAAVNKARALGILNYSIGFAMFNDPAMKKEAGNYFYKSSQYESPLKNNPLLYQAIGANYLDEIIALDPKRTAIITANGGKDNDESLAIEAMQRGYAERALEAYARAYKSAKAEPAKYKKEYLDGLTTKLKGLYTTRYEGKTLDNVDTFTATATSKPLTNPSTTVEPIKEEVPATTPPTSGTTTTPATTPATTKPATPATTKPATTTPAKPVGSTTPATTTEDGTTTAATTKPKAKKPAPKKKGTR